jgi:hypothetical protein
VPAGPPVTFDRPDKADTMRISDISHYFLRRFGMKKMIQTKCLDQVGRKDEVEKLG